jgi:3-demethoxyubiquinol 3-hydroxylase
VVDHLDGHLRQLPPEDERSRAILEQMRADEARHGNEAAAAGGRPLPPLIRGLMRRAAQVMTRSAYWV